LLALGACSSGLGGDKGEAQADRPGDERQGWKAADDMRRSRGGRNAVDVQVLSPFGAEVDIDLRVRPAEQDAALQRLFRQHHLLVFRGQALTAEEQLEFMALFGRPLRSAIDGVGYITNEDVPENVLGNSELAFHSDLSFSPQPFDAISLQAVQVADGRSTTRFVDGARAYRRLPPDLQDRIGNLHTLQVFGGPNLGGRNGADVAEHLPSHVHPVVMRHPQTAEEFLYVCYNQTARIVELDENESDALIGELFDHLYAPAEIYEHAWHNGDLVVWDNLAIQHARGATGDVGVRRLQRAVAAEAGFFEQYPAFREASLSGAPAVPSGA